MDGLKLLLVFVLMMLLLWRRVSLLLVMLGSSLLLAALYRTSPGAFLDMVWQATKSPTTIELFFILTLIMLLEYFLRQHGYLERMLRGLRALIHDRRIVVALLPAFIGLMPSPGGALFSAPLVGETAANTNLTSEGKSFINYYYRHIWEYFMPLYPGVILAAQLSDLSLPRLIMALVPYGLLVLLLGLPYLRLAVVQEDKEDDAAEKDRRALAGELWSGILPILVVVGLVLIRVQVWLAAGLVLLALIIYHRYNLAKMGQLFREALGVKTLLLVWGIMLFKQVLQNTHAVDGIAQLISKLPVPEFVFFGLLSFLVGMLTGLTIAYVGIVFPIILATMGQISLSLTVFVFITGFTGYMLTPMHLCLVLTVDYFKSDLHKVLRMVLGPEMVLLAAAVVGYLFL